jgi:hypothetical protein
MRGPGVPLLEQALSAGSADGGTGIVEPPEPEPVVPPDPEPVEPPEPEPVVPPDPEPVVPPEAVLEPDPELLPEPLPEVPELPPEPEAVPPPEPLPDLPPLPELPPELPEVAPEPDLPPEPVATSVPGSLTQADDSTRRVTSHPAAREAERDTTGVKIWVFCMETASSGWCVNPRGFTIGSSASGSVL